MSSTPTTIRQFRSTEGCTLVDEKTAVEKIESLSNISFISKKEESVSKGEDAESSDVSKGEGEVDASASTPERKEATLTRLFEQVIETTGEDRTRPGLKKTPGRAARAIVSLTEGYSMNLREVVNGAVFKEEDSSGGLVAICHIPFYSLCEHHMLPFFGSVHIGYVPDGYVLGLSKFARIVDMFAKRLQVQERLTRDIADAIGRVVPTKGIAVVVQGRHMCMEMRGVEKASSQTTSTFYSGVLKTDRGLKDDFWNSFRRGR